MPQTLIFGAVLVLAIYGLLFLFKNFLHVSKPNEMLIFSGSSSKSADGKSQGVLVVTEGWRIRRPILETLSRMDTSLISVPMTVEGAYSEGGIPLSMRAIANVKIATDPQYVQNAIVRFLGRDPAEIGQVAKETLEGHLRGVLSNMTPEEVNEDRLKFAKHLAEEAEDDLHKLGLHLDTLKIQNVSDGVNYLDSIGRERIAIILQEAEVAESDAVRAAEESEAAAVARARVAKTQAQAAIQRKQNELREIQADLDALAKSEEERATAAPQAARALAEKELQEIRAGLEQLRLEGEVVIPAQMEQQAAELPAAGAAAPTAENGRAMAEALRTITQAWKDCGDSAMNIFVLQRIEGILGQVAHSTKDLKVHEVSLMDSGEGKALSSYVSAYPAVVGSVLREVCNTLGVDLSGALSGRPATAPSNGHALAPAAHAGTIPAPAAHADTVPAPAAQA
jgi:flotillin